MRFEYKFVVPQGELQALRAGLAPFVAPDHFADVRAQKEYTVRSIYFDTARFDFYHEKLEGLQFRKKIRVRGYNEPEERSLVYLEVKKKITDHCLKHRAPFLLAELSELFRTGDVDRHVLPGRNSARALDDAVRFFYHLRRQALRSTVLVTYEREAFHGILDPTLRITFDKHLRCRLYPRLEDLYEERYLEPVLFKSFILEIKFNRGFSSWLQSLLQHHHLQRSGFSKYASCLEAILLNPKLRRHLRLAALPPAVMLQPTAPQEQG